MANKGIEDAWKLLLNSYGTMDLLAYLVVSNSKCRERLSDRCFVPSSSLNTLTIVTYFHSSNIMSRNLLT